jgi:hypothetical protein
MKTAVYIASSPRSGSTLLTNILGNHPKFLAVGELDKLQSYLTNGTIGRIYDWKCPCGELLKNCSLWAPAIECVASRLKLDLTDLITQAHAYPQLSVEDLIWPRRSAARLFHWAQTSSEAAVVARNNFALMDALIEQTGMTVIVDSSKSIYTLASYIGHLPADWHIKVIHLIRDPRATSISMLRRAKKEGGRVRSIVRYMIGWRLLNGLLKEVIAQLPESCNLTVKHEFICESYEKSILRTLEFIGHPCEVEGLLHSVKQRHDISGSPSMLNNRDIIKLRTDKSWLDALNLNCQATHLLITRYLAKKLAQKSE